MKEPGLREAVYCVALVAVGGCNALQAQSSGRPQVSILWPDSSARITLEYIKIKAEAASSNSSIVQVQFFAQYTNLLGVVTNPPFDLLWFVDRGITNQPNELILNAVATDNLGLNVTSAPVTLFVFQGPPPSPIVHMTSPQPGAVLAAPATLLMSAELLGSIGDTGPEEFFVNTNSVGIVNTNGSNEMFTVSTPPVSLTVSNLAEGSYKLGVHYLGADGYYCSCDSVNVSVVKLAVDSPVVGSDGQIQFDVVTSYTNRQNVIEVSSNLQSWASISTNLPSTTRFTFTGSSPFAGVNRFYRVVVPPQ